MNSDQIKLLTSLAKEIRTEKKERAKVSATLQLAKILTRNGNFTSIYGNLSRVAVKVK